MPSPPSRQNAALERYATFVPLRRISVLIVSPRRSRNGPRTFHRPSVGQHRSVIPLVMLISLLKSLGPRVISANTWCGCLPLGSWRSKRTVGCRMMLAESMWRSKSPAGPCEISGERTLPPRPSAPHPTACTSTLALTKPREETLTQ